MLHCVTVQWLLLTCEFAFHYIIELTLVMFAFGLNLVSCFLERVNMTNFCSTKSNYTFVDFEFVFAKMDESKHKGPSSFLFFFFLFFTFNCISQFAE